MIVTAIELVGMLIYFACCWYVIDRLMPTSKR
jgi:hypothetical protein